MVFFCKTRTQKTNNRIDPWLPTNAKLMTTRCQRKRRGEESCTSLRFLARQRARQATPLLSPAVATQPCLVAGQLCSRMQPSQLMRHRFKAWILPPTHKRRRLTLAPRPTPRPKTVVKIPADPAVSQPLDDPQHTSWISHH